MHPDGVIELLRRHDVPIAGAKVVLVGRGITVGRPLGLMLTRRSENATVRCCHTGTRDLAAEVRQADIVVAAAGVPGHHHARTWSSPAQQCSTSASAGSWAMTASPGSPATSHPTWRRSPGWISPNPGGVGPMTRAMLLTNVVEAAERAAAAS